MSMPGQVIYMEGGEELLDRIEPLWSELNKLHAECPVDFSDFYKKMTFKAKKDFFSEKTRDGFLKVITAQTDSAKEIGYCVSTLTREGRGEIEYSRSGGVSGKGDR